MISDKSRALKLAEEKKRILKQKEDQIINVIVTLKANPKFIKLLTFSLNSMDTLITPPNREIKLNSKLIIQNDGVAVLKITASINISNEEIVTVHFYMETSHDSGALDVFLASARKKALEMLEHEENLKLIFLHLLN